MLVYVVRRLLWTPFLLLAVTFITFVLGHYGPGDPIKVMFGERVNPEAVARIRHERGLDRPLFVQYADYVWKAIRGDFGESFKFRGQKIGELIPQKVLVSAQLGFVALMLSVLIGLPLGVITALRQGRWLDPVTVSTTLFFMSVPGLLVAPLLIWVLVILLHWLPSGGWGGLLDGRIIMPAIVMALPGIASWTRLMRASTLDVLGQDFIRTARAKGLRESMVQFRHVARNALIPIMTVLGLSLGTLVEGAFITEGIFGIPGIGRLAVDSLFARDYPVITAITLVIAVSFVAANLFVDLMYAYLDPRISYR